MRVFETGEAPCYAEPNSGKGRYITVFILPYRSNELRTFRCINCSRIVFKYESDIAMIVDSPEAPLSEAPIETMCKYCKIIYRIVW